MEYRFPSFSLAKTIHLPYFCKKNGNDMKKKTIGIIVAVLLLAFVGVIGWYFRNLPQKRFLKEAEDIVFIDVDSAAKLLAKIDSTRLTQSSQMLYDLMRALVKEERDQLLNTDTVSCLSSADTTILVSSDTDRPKPVTSPVWNFKRTMVSQKTDDQVQLSDSSLLRVYEYYEHASLGGTADDKEALRRFGRICWVLSQDKGKTLHLNSDKLLHLAIHCGEADDDHALGYRAYHLLGQRTEGEMQLLCQTRALQQYRLSPDHTRWLLTLLNDYGHAVLKTGPFDLHRFASLECVANIVSRQHERQLSANVCDSVFLCLDSLWALPAPGFKYAVFSGYSYDGKTNISEFSVPADTYEDNQQRHEKGEAESGKPEFESKWQDAINAFNISQDTYLAAGYAMKTASLQQRLMTAVIVILLLSLLLLALLFRNWRNKTRQRHEAERTAHQREAEQLTERLRQKDVMITMLRDHIMDKSEILDMLEPTAGKRTIINARNWREIEMTLDTADGNFVSRLRTEHPEFSEEDIRLCMLTRLRLSNNALAAIYVISVSAVQHRKQKLKKEGFGITDPSVTLDQFIAEY